MTTRLCFPELVSGNDTGSKPANIVPRSKPGHFSELLVFYHNWKISKHQQKQAKDFPSNPMVVVLLALPMRWAAGS